MIIMIENRFKEVLPLLLDASIVRKNLHDGAHNCNTTTRLHCR